MTILDSLRSLFARKQEPTTTTQSPTPSMPSALARRFQAETERLSVVRVCQAMYDTDPRAKEVLRMQARDAVKAGFELTVSDGPNAERAQEVADALLKRLKLGKVLTDWTRLSSRDGDTFLELGITAGREIVTVTRKPALQMRRNSDDFDRFEDATKAFVWGDESIVHLLHVAGGDVVYFPEFLIIHARWNHDSDDRYGTPEFASSNGVWKKVTEGELDISIRRKTRAGLKYNHKFPEGTSQTEIAAYMETNKDALDNPFAAAADYFGTVDINAIEGDARLAEIGDVEHHIQTWSASSPVALELIAYGANLNRDVLGEKKEQYDETLGDVREWIADELILPIVERQWLLAGILPESLEYAIDWPVKKQLDPAGLSALADAALRFKTLGWDDEAITQVIGPYLPAGVDLESIMSHAAEANDNERLGDNADALGGDL